MSSVSASARRHAAAATGAAHSRRAVMVAGLAGVSAMTLAACGADASEPRRPPAETSRSAAGPITMAPDGVQEVTVAVGDDYVFAPDSFTVAPGRVRLTLRSDAEQLTHNLRFSPGKGPVDIPEQVDFLPPGARETFEFTANKPGDYQYECSFHTSLGQIGTMTVTPSA